VTHTHTRTHTRTHTLTHSLTHSLTLRGIEPPSGRHGTSNNYHPYTTLWCESWSWGGSREPSPLHTEGNLGLSPGGTWHMGTVLATCIRACELKPWRLWRVSRGSRIPTTHDFSLNPPLVYGSPATPVAIHSKRSQRGSSRSPSPAHRISVVPVTLHLLP